MLLTLWFAVSCGWKPLAMVLGAAVLHETGHILALYLFRCRIMELRIDLLGAVLEAEQRMLSYGREMIAVLAGPAANAVAAVAFSQKGALAFAGANIILCVYNLLPIRPLDGGRALELLLCWSLGPDTGERVVRSVSAGAALLASAMVCVLIWESGGNLWLAAATVGLFRISLREMFGKT